MLVLTACASHAQDDVTTTATATTTTVSETEAFGEAEAMYNLLIGNRDVWEIDNMQDATLVDLDFDGTPEFLLTVRGTDTWLNALSIFKIDGGGLKEFYRINDLYYNDNVFVEALSIVPYTDDGVKLWLIPYKKDGNYRLSAFDFTGGEVKETVKFSSVIYDNTYDSETNEYIYGYEGYPFVKTEFYAYGEEVKAPDNVTKEFFADIDEMIREQEAEYANGYSGPPGYPWSCAGYYPNPSQQLWEEMKTDFLKSQVAVESAYTLFPNSSSRYEDYTVMIGVGAFYYEEEINTFLLNTVNSYYGGGDNLRTTELWYNNEGAACKPVIYLYPPKPTDVSVRVKFPKGGGFTCTYPDYGDGWNVTAYEDGRIINKADGYEYSYLYWEGEGFPKWDFSRGFVVAGKDTAAFLREKLSYMGLTPREYNEFIVYWLPLMQGNAYNLIAFQTTAYTDCAVLEVTPKPDSMLRVFMAYMPLDEAIDIQEQELARFERKGFCVVEWGGTTVN